MDQLEFQRLTREHGDPLYRRARRLTRTAADADDLLQDALERGWRHAEELESPAGFGGWMRTIMVRIRLRAAGRPSLDLVSLDHLPEADLPPGDLEAEILSGRFSEQVARALAALPDELRIAVLLVDVEGQTFEDTAAIMRCPIGTAKSRVFRARSAIAEQVTRHLSRRGGGGGGVT